MKEYEVKLLEDAVRFLRKLPVKLRAKAFRAVELLEEFGPNLPMPHAKALKGTDGLSELRIKFGSDIARLFYFHDKDRIYIVTSGFIKKNKKRIPAN
ncbi:MAG: type II toxin-antitoxin system RelE/ParE family toxin [Lentisphaeria bacterium]|nr:type II toxin-antitoxin system RelE/ParE family toxin [Lentisphaeria bacterium]